MDLIAGSEAELAALYPPEERFALSPQQLIDGDVHFVVLRDGGTSLGCGGLAPYPDYGELKRIYVVPERRGQGHAHRILNALEAHGR
ncbi:MAG: GNAT family N-acetyltransferase, partial [Pseudomonadota bacterium]